MKNRSDDTVSVGKIKDGFPTWPFGAVYWNRTYNPYVGCTPVSPACANCYARTMMERFNSSFEPHKSKQKNPPRRGIVFVGNATDIAGEWLDSTQIAEEIVKCVRASQSPKYMSQYLILTKRVKALSEALSEVSKTIDSLESINGEKFDLQNVIVGMTAENQEWYNKRICDFQTHRFKRTWLSAEPLLGPIDLNLQNMLYKPFSWVVVGCESGAKRRPCDIEWVRGIVNQCKAAKIPVFVKQLDIDGKCEKDIRKFPKDLQIRQMPFLVLKGLLSDNDKPEEVDF